MKISADKLRPGMILGGSDWYSGHKITSVSIGTLYRLHANGTDVIETPDVVSVEIVDEYGEENGFTVYSHSWGYADYEVL